MSRPFSFSRETYFMPRQVPPGVMPRSRYVTARQLQLYIQQLQLIVNEALANDSSSSSGIPAEGDNYKFDGTVLKIKATNGTNLRVDFVPDGSDYNFTPTP